MKIEKVLNNNVVQALDNNVEYVVMGKGCLLYTSRCV